MKIQPSYHHYHTNLLTSVNIFLKINSIELDVSMYNPLLIRLKYINFTINTNYA